MQQAPDPLDLLDEYSDNFSSSFIRHVMNLKVDSDYYMKKRQAGQANRGAFLNGYIPSPHWKYIRLLCFYRQRHMTGAEPHCTCGSTRNLQVHHTTYEHLGVEPVHLEDLEILCAACHMAKHPEHAIAKGHLPLQYRLAFLPLPEPQKPILLPEVITSPRKSEPQRTVAKHRHKASA